MKKVLLFVTIAAALISCDEKQKKISEIDLQTTDSSEKWELVKMTGSMVGSETTGDEMEWQEYYIFNTDGTFTKQRERNNEVAEASGTYEKETNENGLVYKLTYSEENELVGSCSGASQEYLYYDSDEQTLLSNWWACDGPGLYYEQVK